MGAYWFGPVRPSVSPSVCPSVRKSLAAEKLKNRLCWNLEIIYICGMYMKKKQTRIFFFPPPVLSFWSYAPFSTMHEQPCEQNI